MAIDLFGDHFVDGREYAKKIVSKAISLPFYKIKKHPDYNIEYFHGDEKVHLNEPGLYAIYRKVDGKMEALYNGISAQPVNQRVYRFIKELDGRSRKDETHPGAKKARLHGIKSSDDLYVKVLYYKDFPIVQNAIFPLVALDEYIAPILGSKFNKKVKR